MEEESLTGDEKKVPRLKVKIGSGSTGEVKVQSGVASEVGVKVGRRLSQSSRTPESEDESANRYVTRYHSPWQLIWGVAPGLTQ